MPRVRRNYAHLSGICRGFRFWLGIDKRQGSLQARPQDIQAILNLTENLRVHEIPVSHAFDTEVRTVDRPLMEISKNRHIL